MQLSIKLARAWGGFGALELVMRLRIDLIELLMTEKRRFSRPSMWLVLISNCWSFCGRRQRFAPKSLEVAFNRPKFVRKVSN